ncbi:hypothetical protein BS78_01G194600 [Paspalum vaginatum]|nr:hypothetical protein BS78_01G194600 [Paspalum vaginatum]
MAAAVAAGALPAVCPGVGAAEQARPCGCPRPPRSCPRPSVVLTGPRVLPLTAPPTLQCCGAGLRGQASRWRRLLLRGAPASSTMATADSLPYGDINILRHLLTLSSSRVVLMQIEL